MRLNVPNHLPPIFTHEGAPAKHISPEAQLRRAVLACLLWEDQFYESGQSIAQRIEELCTRVKPATIAALAVEARKVMHLRHVPLLLCSELVKHGPELAADCIARTVSRADELAELLAIYWRNGRCPVDRQLRKGLAAAFRKFDEYQLGKYNRDGAIRLRDVLRIARPKPENEAQSALWKRVVAGELKTPDTWEVALSGGADKRETFTRLIEQDKLGYFALLRNLRNMVEAGVKTELIRQALLARKNGAQNVLPFRYFAAIKAAPSLARTIDQALGAAIGELPQPAGMTFILVDVSGSMDAKLSGKSDLTRLEAGAALASIWPGPHRTFTFSDSVVEVPPYPGGAGMAAIIQSQAHGGTYLGAAVTQMNALINNNGLRNGADRLIVITDEQSHDPVPDPLVARAYMINVASNKNGVGYGKWTHLDGFSEGVLRYIYEIERTGDA